MSDFCIDFDGTCTTDNFPEIGKEIGAPRVLKRIVDSGHRIIIYTVRSKEHLDPVIKWYEKHNIPYWSINHNPEQIGFSASRKVHADHFIDDKSIGVPLLTYEAKKYVDWAKVEKILEQMGLI